MRRRTVAVMQPYLYPYAGYFRLMTAADVFVIFDDVQFPRRGRVHRCEMNQGDRKNWLTLPLANQPRSTLIKDIAFAEEARAIFDQRLQRYAFLHNPQTPVGRRLRDHLYGPLGVPIDFLEKGLKLVADALDLPATLIRSSSLGLPEGLRGQDRIIAVARALGADAYVNAPGGRLLYDHKTFQEAGISLHFLPVYDGRYLFILNELVQHDLLDLRYDVIGDFWRTS